MASYSFEHINRVKAPHIKADSRNLLSGRERAYPNDNYLSGDGKSEVWDGWSYYAPHNRSWQLHHDKKALPRDRIPYQKEFQTEDEWREFQGRRDKPGSAYPAGMGWRNSSACHLKLNGYAFNPFNLHRTGAPATTLYNSHEPWPTVRASDRKFPVWRGPRGYYGYYHEELDVHHGGGYRYSRDPKHWLMTKKFKSIPTCTAHRLCTKNCPSSFPF